MSNVKISDLPAATTMGLTDVFPFTQGTTTKKATLEQVRQFIAVTDYGVTGTGDETVLICAAMEAAYAAGVVLEWPAGTGYTIAAASMPAGTNHAPAMRGIGEVTINLTGAVVFTVANGFSLENLNLLTTYTYANATATYYHLFTTGTNAASPRLVNCKIKNVSYKQLTVTDGSARGYSLANFAGGVTNLDVETLVCEGIREGIQIQSDGHDGETVRCVIGGRFENVHGSNMQRVIAIDAIPTTGLFGSEGIRINNFSLINTATQRDNYSGGARTGHSPIIGDLGLNPSITNVRIQHPIEHWAYVYAKRAVFDNIYGANMADLSFKGYSTSNGCSGSIRIVDNRLTSAPYSATLALVSLANADGVDIEVVQFKGTNLSGGPSGHLIRPWAVVSLAKSAKNVKVKANGQYLLQGVVNYETNSAQEEAFENIVIEQCHVLDPQTTTSSGGYAALKKYDANFPTLGWYSAGTALVKNLTIRNNYFGVTTETADIAETTTVICRGRLTGTKLNGLFNCADMAGVLSENNTVDGWYGDGNTTQMIGVNTAGAGVQGYVTDVVIRETYQGLETTTFTTGPGALFLGEGSEIKFLNNGATATPSGRIVAYKGRSSGGGATVVEAMTAAGQMDGSITFRLLAAGSLGIMTIIANIEGTYDFHTDTGEYGYGEISNSTLKSITVSANADATTDTALKVCTYISGTSMVAKNNTAGTVFLTFNFKGSYNS